MSIDEMIEEIETHKYSCYPVYGLDDDIGKRIIAALRAAEGMYKGYSILERQGRQSGFLDSRDHEKLLRAWDEATKEGV
jgi:hypothetical protein